MAALCSDAVYSDNGAYIMRWLSDHDRDIVSVNTVSSDNVQAMVIHHRRFVVVSFRGTDEPRDWVSNLNALTVSTPLGGVHKGFHKALDKVVFDIDRQIGAARLDAQHFGHGRGLPLYLTGHSLGGALATLYAARLVEADDPFYALYTFGSPRCGDREWARTFNAEAKDRTFRFCNNNDIVTRVPSRLMGYSHVGTFRYITEDGDIEDDPGFWFRFLDSVKGAVRDLGDLGLDGVKDHDITTYREALKHAT